MNINSIAIRLAVLVISIFSLASCNVSNSWQKKDPLALPKLQQPVSCTSRTPGAIYQQGSNTYLYGSNRAHRVGDLLTVHVDENLNAQDNNSSETSRKSDLKDTIALTKVINPGSLEVNGDNQYAGSGKSLQSNKITGDITATVMAVLANNNLVIRGYKTLTLSNGVERIGIAGIVRPEDINSEDNSVLSSKIADEHVAYFGRGDLYQSSHKGWFSRLFSGLLWPV